MKIGVREATRLALAVSTAAIGGQIGVATAQAQSAAAATVQADGPASEAPVSMAPGGVTEEVVVTGRQRIGSH